MYSISVLFFLDSRFLGILLVFSFSVSSSEIMVLEILLIIIVIIIVINTIFNIFKLNCVLCLHLFSHLCSNHVRK